MRKFLIKSVVFLIIGIIILMGLNLLYTRTNAYRSGDDTDKFHNVPYGLNIVSFGSSHGMKAFDFENKKDAFNFALSAQDFYYDYEILKQYSDYFNKGCTVFIPVSYFSFGVGYDEFKISNIDLRYYKFLNYNSIKHHNIKDLIERKFLPILVAHDDFKYVFKDKSTYKNDWEFINKNVYSSDEINDMGKKRAEYHQKINHTENYSSNLKILDNIIKFCMDKGFNVVLITTPFTKHYNGGFNKSFYDSFYKQINDKCLKYDIKYFDYSHDKQFEGDDTLFVDTDHLNSIGRKKFTDMMLKNYKNKVY